MTENINILPRKINLKKYNAKEFFEFTKDKEERYELIDGQIKLMASPSVQHQNLTFEIGRKIGNYLEDKKCRVFMVPLDVVLFERKNKDKKKKDNAQNVFQPDIFVVCDPKKIAKNRINGAPNLIIEVVSPSNSSQDYIKKLDVYMEYGVREYWIVNPETKQIFVNINGRKVKTYIYTFEDKIKSSIFEDFEIDFKELL